MLRKFLSKKMPTYFVYAFVATKRGHTFRLMVVAQNAVQARAYVSEAGYTITHEGNFFETKTTNINIISVELLS